VKQDNELLQQLQACLLNKNTDVNFVVKEGILYWKKRVVVSADPGSESY